MVERSRKALMFLSELDAFDPDHQEYVFIIQCALLATSDMFLISNNKRQEVFDLKSQAQKLLLQAYPVCILDS